MSSGRRIDSHCKDHLFLLGFYDVFGRVDWVLLSALMLTSGHLLFNSYCTGKPSSINMTETWPVAEVGSPLRLGAVFIMKQSWWTDGFSFFWIDLHAPQQGTTWEGDWNTISRYFPSFPLRIFSCGRAWGLTQHLWEDGERSRGEPTTAPEEEGCAALLGGPEKGELMAAPLFYPLALPVCSVMCDTFRVPQGGVGAFECSVHRQPLKIDLECWWLNQHSIRIGTWCIGGH